MKKTCIDCIRFNRECFGGSICESFEWKDKRIEAGERALRVLWRIAKKMMDEHEVCEEMMKHEKGLS